MKKLTALLLAVCSVFTAVGTLSSCDDSSSGKDKHDYKEEILLEATCAQQGVRSFTCEDCGDSYFEEYSLPTLSASEVFEQSKNSVGEITTYDKNGNALSLGTGFVYSEDGKIITNYHVIEEAYSAKITVNGLSRTVSQVLAYDKDVDLAVLKVSAKNLPTLKICTNEHAVGCAVYAIGSSKGLTGTFSQGIISYDDRVLSGVHYVQHTADISSGNSGGPLINAYGEIIGINTMTMRDSQNLNFAISVKELSNLVYLTTPLTLAQVYEKECDTLAKIKNYAKEKGTYSSANNCYSLVLGYEYSNDYKYKYSRVLSYDVSEDEICLMLLIDSDYFLAITIDEIDGVYDWGYLDTNDYYLSGVIYASTFNTNSSLIYTQNDVPSSMRPTVLNLATAMAKMLVVSLNNDLKAINVTAQDLGFKNY